MSSTSDAILMPLALLIAVNLISVVAYVAIRRMQVRREQRNVANVALAIIDYFKRSGVNVACSCTRLPGKTVYTAFVESEPMKRFRLSHIIEMTLREHVSKSCNLELGKVYWRFPIKEAKRMKEAAERSDVQSPQPDVPLTAEEQREAELAAQEGHIGTDEYINEGLEHYKYIPKVEAEEMSWEQFEQASGNTDGGHPPQSDR